MSPSNSGDAKGSETVSGELLSNKYGAFWRALTPEARKLCSEPMRPEDLKVSRDGGSTIARVDGKALRFSSMVRTVQWPVDDWYKRRMARLFNEVVAAGGAAGVHDAGVFKLAGGSDVSWGAGDASDYGPNGYGALFVFFWSGKTREELMAASSVPAAFVRDGGIPSAGAWAGGLGVFEGEKK